MLPTSPDLATIVKRLDVLERDNRRWKKLSFLLAVGLVLVVAGGAASTIKDGLIVRDRDGTIRIALTVHSQDVRSVFLHMNDDRDRQVLRLGNHAVNGTFFEIYGRNGTPRICLGVDRNDQVYFTVHDPSGRPVHKLF